MTLKEWETLTYLKGRLEGLAFGIANDSIKEGLFDAAEIMGEVLDKAQERGLTNEL